MAADLSIDRQSSGTEPETDALYPHRSLTALFEHTARTSADRIAVSSDGGALTFAELDTLADRIAFGIRAACAAPGGRVALLMAQELRSFGSILAVLKARQIAVSLDPADPPARLRELLDDARPAAILVDRCHRDIALSIADPGATIMVVDELSEEGRRADDQNDAPGLGDVAMLIYTSGTTGRPKGVMQSHGHIMRNAFANIRRMAVSPADRIMLVTSPWGALGNDTIWIAFASGAGLVSHPANVNGVTGLGERLNRDRITIHISASSLFRHFIKSLDPTQLFPGVRYVKLTADPATSDDLAAVRRHFPNASLLSTAGMSEIGDIAWLPISPDVVVGPGRLPIGSPIEGIDIRLVDETGSPVPHGSVGRLMLAARHMAVGYWRDPDLTARYFSVADGRQVFRSADLGRLDHQGRLVLVGRDDATVKIRGQRVDFAEVERGLSALPDVAAAAADAVPRSNGELELVAYIVPVAGESLTARALRAMARARMPRHLVPTTFVFLDRLPLAANGKVDRPRLRNMRPPAKTGGELPINAIEAALVRIWEDAFDLDEIGRGDDFFDLGGDSLIAAVIAARVRAAFGVELSFRHFVEHAGLAAMAAAIDSASKSGGHLDEPPLTPVDRARPLPLSFMQASYWQRGGVPHRAARHTRAVCARVDGPLDPALFRDSIADVVRHQEILRTRYMVIDGEPMQLVEAPPEAGPPLIDWSWAADGEERVADMTQAESRRVFDLMAAEAPMNFVFIRTAPQVHWLIQSAHHILTDVFSWNIFLADLAEAYELRLGGSDRGLPPLPIQYGDFAVWQRQRWSSEAKLTAMVAWWGAQFGTGLEPTILPFRQKRPERPAGDLEGRLTWGLAPAASRRLDGLSSETGATYYMLRLAGVAAVLAALTGRDEVLVGGVFTNRNRLEYQRMCGPFFNAVMLRLRCSWGSSFRAFVAEVRDYVSAAQANAEIPMGRLMEEMKAQGVSVPRLSVTVHVRSPHPPVHFAGLRISTRTIEPPMTSGVVIAFSQFAEADDCYIRFDERLFARDTIDTLQNALARFFDEAARDPDAMLRRLIDTCNIAPLESSTGWAGDAAPNSAVQRRHLAFRRET
jgi:non-ribosomal peptide synthetase component F